MTTLNTHNKTISELEQATWILAALVTAIDADLLVDSSSSTNPEHLVVLEVLESAGLIVRDGGAIRLGSELQVVPLETRRTATVSVLRQIAHVVGIVESSEGLGWSVHDDETLLAQGKSSAFGGMMLASMAVPFLTGLADSFAAGGRMLDVGTGVGELAAAFADEVPTAEVVGLDVLPRAIALAEEMIHRRGLGGRVEVRLQSVDEFVDHKPFDLARMPAPFIPPAAFRQGLKQIASALRPGGWIVVGAGRFDEDPVSTAVTRWQTARARGTLLTAAEAAAELLGAGFTDVTEIPTPPGGPAIYAARQPA